MEAHCAPFVRRQKVFWERQAEIFWGLCEGRSHTRISLTHLPNYEEGLELYRNHRPNCAFLIVLPPRFALSFAGE